MNGSVIGFADAALQQHEDQGTYDRPGVYAYAEELIVTSAYRRRGVATALMRALERWAKTAGARAIVLDTHVTNAEARSLYHALGYREMGVDSPQGDVSSHCPGPSEQQQSDALASA